MSSCMVKSGCFLFLCELFNKSFYLVSRAHAPFWRKVNLVVRNNVRVPFDIPNHDILLFHFISFFLNIFLDIPCEHSICLNLSIFYNNYNCVRLWSTNNRFGWWIFVIWVYEQHNLGSVSIVNGLVEMEVINVFLSGLVQVVQPFSTGHNL